MPQTLAPMRRYQDNLHFSGIALRIVRRAFFMLFELIKTLFGLGVLTGIIMKSIIDSA